MVPAEVLAHPPHITLTVDCTRAPDHEIVHIRELEEIVNFGLLKSFIVVRGPLMMPLGHLDCSINCDGQVCDVANHDREHVEGMVGGDKHLAISLCVISLDDRCYECLLILKFSIV